MTDKPIPSPRPKQERPDVDDDLGPEEKTDPKLAALREATLTTNLKTRVIALIFAGVLSGTTLGGVAYAYERLRGVAHDAGVEAAEQRTGVLDAGLKGIEARVTVVEQQIPELRQEVGRLRESQYQSQLDARDLYKAVMEGKRSERLERPPPAPPPPPVVKKDGG